jgi:hypothetical protein
MNRIPFVIESESPGFRKVLETRFSHLRVAKDNRPVAALLPGAVIDAPLVVVEEREPVATADPVALGEALLLAVVRNGDGGPGEGAIWTQIHPPEREIVQVRRAAAPGGKGRPNEDQARKGKSPEKSRARLHNKVSPSTGNGLENVGRIIRIPEREIFKTDDCLWWFEGKQEYLSLQDVHTEIINSER